VTAHQQEPRDLIDAIITDHREVQNLFKEIEEADDSSVRRRIVEHVVTELVRHSVAEEQYLYPTARRVLPAGDELADHELEEHAKAEEIMKQLERLEWQAEDVDFGVAVRKLIEEVRHHIEEEEADLLPKLRDTCDAAELAELGEKFENAKKVAPTRPHPSAPDKPPANKILDPGVGLIDRMRDALSGRNS
jgi:hemerythrin-like domain-containing protein